MTRNRFARVMVPPLGLLALGGCPVDVQRNVEFLFAPHALENALRLPFSGILPLVELIGRVLIG